MRTHEQGRLPTKEECNIHNRELRGNFHRVLVAGGVTVGVVAASLAFPPAIVGVLPPMLETARQGVRLNMRVIRFHGRYPDLGRRARS